jgi:serine/threonine-protein kinase
MSPVPDRDAVLTKLVASALARPAAERDALLEGVRQSDPTLYREILSRIESEEPTVGLLPYALRDPSVPHSAGAAVLHYRILEKLGEGGMGVVYKAEDTRLQRTVALKFLASASLAEPARRRFLQEARAAARIQHPNICPIFEIGEQDGRLFFAMAFVEGSTITQLVQSGPLPLETALEIAIGIANGLDEAHRQGVVHRDIKSSNIVVDRNGHPSILDFGIALNRDAERVTQTGGAIGTPAYMSPEQAQGQPVDHRTDLWSLGVVLFEMLTGSLPFRRDSQFSVLHAIVREESPAVSALRPELPADLDAFLNKALTKDPERRWQSAADMAAALRAIRPGSAGYTPTVDVVAPAAAPPKRSWAKLVVAGLIALALTLTAILIAPAIRPPVPTLPEQEQIAVLPLQITGNQNDDTVRALADGLVETLTAKLSQVEDFQGKLLVIPASEIRSRKIASAEDARRVYNANLVFTGNAQRWGNVIEINQVLVSTSTPPRQFGANNLRFPLDNPIEMRDSAVARAVELLALKLSPVTEQALAAGETKTSGAYAQYLRGVGYLARYDVSGNVDRALAALESATAQDPNYALAWAALGDAHWRKAKQTSDKQQASLALENIHEALRIDPQFTAAHIKLGLIYSESGQPDLAIAEEMNALRIAPGNAQAYRALGEAYTATSRFSEAEAAYRQGIAHQPADWYGHLLLGFFYLQRSRLSDARTEFEAARKLTPDNEVVYSNIAGLDVSEGKYQDALDLYSKTLKFEPGARTWSAIGLANYYLRRYQAASDAIDKSIAIDPSMYQNWGNRGTVYRHLPGHDERARESFRKAIELATKTLEVLQGDFRAHANLAEYWAKLGDSRKALAEIDLIPASAREPYLDRIVLAYEFSGERRRAVETIRAIPAGNSALIALKNDPDLDSLWRDFTAR